MKDRFLFLLACGSAAASLGCGSDASTSNGAGGDASTGDASIAHDGGGDASIGDAAQGDSAMSSDSAGDSAQLSDGALMCGNTTCSGGDVCCATIADGGTSGTLTCMPSCPDGGVTIACSGPGQCTSAAPVCCAHITIGPGNPPTCPFQSIAAACEATCTTQITLSCPGTDTARLCQAAGDCASDSQNQNCCLFTQGGQSATFCVSNALKNFAVSCL